MDEDSYYLPDFYDITSPGLPNDMEFYVDESLQADPPVLEIACGTGRVLIPIAEAGVRVVGMDISHTMLARARHKIAGLLPETQQRIELVEGDMRDFDLGRQFALIMIPYRAFQHLLKPEDQRRALHAIRKHLTPRGRLIINLFDPRLSALAERISPSGAAAKCSMQFTHPHTGNQVLLWSAGRQDLVEQHTHELWIYEEIDDQGVCLQRQTRFLELRWTYRYEMQYLLEICGYDVVDLYGDFERGPYRHGGEQIWVVRRSQDGSSEDSVSTANVLRGG